MFEDRLEHSELGTKYIGSVDYPYIIFSSSLYSNNNWKHCEVYEEIFTGGKSFSDCEMCILFEKDTYYISFNTIKTKITFSEFKRLKNMFEDIKGQKANVFKKLKEERDEKLLNLVFSNKAKKEKRNILVEKTNLDVMELKKGFEEGEKSIEYNVGQ